MLQDLNQRVLLRAREMDKQWQLREDEVAKSQESHFSMEGMSVKPASEGTGRCGVASRPILSSQLPPGLSAELQALVGPRTVILSTKLSAEQQILTLKSLSPR